MSGLLVFKRLDGQKFLSSTLISEIMDKLKGAKYFTKLDVRWGYNNVQIRNGKRPSKRTKDFSNQR
jgi:hypothetical protein